MPHRGPPFASVAGSYEINLRRRSSQDRSGSIPGVLVYQYSGTILSEKLRPRVLLALLAMQPCRLAEPIIESNESALEAHDPSLVNTSRLTVRCVSLEFAVA